mmetsp:Transcript_2073/g.4196  ORF Transcript_2073/g.4196 Transcript_2073/m.4196 type:complete len:307 (-) Transcript_2073:38-958(-)
MSSFSTLQQVPKVLGFLTLVTIPPSLLQHYYATTTMSSHKQAIDETALPSSVQTTMDMYVDAALPGDIIMFKRSCHKCASSPLAALACYAQQSPTSRDKFDHFGILVPGPEKYSNPMILEATPSSGIRVMDLADRLKYSRSHTISLLPLNVPGERRDLNAKVGVGQRDTPANASRQRLIEQVREDFEQDLAMTAKNQVATSKRINYNNMHSTLSFFGGLFSNYIPASRTTKDLLYKGPLHPQSMVVLESLNKAGALGRQQNIAAGGVQEVIRKGDCNSLVNTNEGDEGHIEMRPGWRYGSPVSLRI